MKDARFARFAHCFHARKKNYSGMLITTHETMVNLVRFYYLAYC